MKSNNIQKMPKAGQAGNGTKPHVGGSFCRITQAQINSIVNAKDDMKAMLGCGDDDTIWKRHIRNIEKFLDNNGLSAK